MSKGTNEEDLHGIERAAWQTLWRDVDKLAKQAAKCQCLAASPWASAESVGYRFARNDKLLAAK